MPALLPQRVEFKYSKLRNDKNKAAPSCIFKNNFFKYPMATNSTDEVEMESQDLSTRPQIKRAPCTILQLSTSWAVTRAREVSCGKKHTVCNINCVQGQARGEGELHFLGNDIHSLGATLCKELELSLAALGWNCISCWWRFAFAMETFLADAQHYLNRDLSSWV